MATGSPIVTFRVDAHREIGLGHLRRCVTLADELRSRGCVTRIVSGKSLAPSVAALAGSHPVLCIGEAARAAVPGRPADAEAADAAATMAAIGASNDASWVVVDSYELGLVFERALSAGGYRVMAIDDFRDRPHHADLLVSDVELPFDPRFNECNRAIALAGRRYTLIGPEYAYRVGPPARSDALRLLISYGGSDPTGETLKALAAIDGIDAVARRAIARVDVAVGQFNRGGEEIAAAARRIAGARVHVAPAGLAALLRECDLFLTAGGNSLVEALALRKPCLVTATADNQRIMVDELAADGMIRVVGQHADVGAAEVGAVITRTCADMAAFAARVAERAVFDHLGAARIADVMLSTRAETQPATAQKAAAGGRE